MTLNIVFIFSVVPVTGDVMSCHFGFDSPIRLQWTSYDHERDEDMCSY